jgi:hypothetical protein
MEAPKLDWPAILEEVCLGNPQAAEFCHTFLHWVHLIDDYIDRDNPNPSQDYVILVNLELLRMLSFNPFWQQHKASLFPVIIQSVQAFADSNRWAKSDDFRKRATADVLKSQYQDVFWHVAYIVGGYEHLNKISQKFRTYDYDAVG